MSAYRLKLQHLRYPLRLGETLLGRSVYCSIVLVGPQVSRQHAAIRVNRDGVQIEDLGSRNGTWVNRRRLTEVIALIPGDKIDVGGHQLEIELENRDERQQPASQAITGEYTTPAELDDGSEELTQPAYVAGEGPEPRR